MRMRAPSTSRPRPHGAVGDKGVQGGRDQVLQNVHEEFAAMKHLQPATAIFTGAASNRLVADVYGETGQPVLLLHGAGRRSMLAPHRRASRPIPGAVAYALDQRGHGDSDWIAGGGYAFTDFAADAAAVAATLRPALGQRPIAIARRSAAWPRLLAAGRSEREGRGAVFAAIVLVDITPRVNRGGVAKIQGFMRERLSAEGFGTIAEAADRRSPPTCCTARARARQEGRERTCACIRTGGGAGLGPTDVSERRFRDRSPRARGRR